MHLVCIKTASQNRTVFTCLASSVAHGALESFCTTEKTLGSYFDHSCYFQASWTDWNLDSHLVLQSIRSQLEMRLCIVVVRHLDVFWTECDDRIGSSIDGDNVQRDVSPMYPARSSDGLVGPDVCPDSGWNVYVGSIAMEYWCDQK